MVKNESILSKPQKGLKSCTMEDRRGQDDAVEQVRGHHVDLCKVLIS
jgi:hypothetical protein